MQNKRTVQKSPFYYLSILVTLLVFTGCTMPVLPTTTAPTAETPDTAEEIAPPADATTSLGNTSWALVSWGVPGAETSVIADSAVTLEFSAAGEVGGNGGCNSYGGTYTVQDDMLVFGEIVSTLMACVDQSVTELEMAYLAALRSAGRFAITDAALTIWVDDENGVLNFVAAAPTAPIDATPVITPGATLTSTASLHSSE